MTLGGWGWWWEVHKDVRQDAGSPSTSLPTVGAERAAYELGRVGSFSRISGWTDIFVGPRLAWMWGRLSTLRAPPPDPSPAPSASWPQSFSASINTLESRGLKLSSKHGEIPVCKFAPCPSLAVMSWPRHCGSSYGKEICSEHSQMSLCVK